MADKQDYLTKLKLVIEQLHSCSAKWRETVPVHEVLDEETVWHGDVEVFELNGNLKAKRAYAWSHREGQGDDSERYVTVLEIPPVDSAQKAVQVQLARDAR